MKKLILYTALASLPLSMGAQSAMDGYQLSRSDLKGTARFMSMAGAFTALGGDLSTLSQNPGGIGIYRSSELGVTFNVDCQSANAASQGYEQTWRDTRFLLNNIGGVATFRLNSSAVPNLNIGFTYNKASSFNRRYRGRVPVLSNSMSNYIAGMTNAAGVTVAYVETTDFFDPYNPNDGYEPAPWLSILGGDSYLISPTGDPEQPVWKGQWGQGTSGSGSFRVEETGGVDEYNIALGGNIANVVYWGMDFGITDLNFTQRTYWGENLSGAYVNNISTPMGANWGLHNYYHVDGTGFNYKLGFIVKPIQELRIGFSFHTPTWYSMSEVYSGRVNYAYDTNEISPNPSTCYTNNQVLGGNDYSFSTPWRINVGLAGVIGSKLIVSADYEWAGYNGMKYSDSNNYDGYYYDDWYGYSYGGSSDDSYYAPVNHDIKTYYKAQHTLRIGAEYRILPQLSVRAGYSFVSSPVEQSVSDGSETIYTAGTNPSYVFDNTTNYATVGLGYRYKKFYADLAYVYKHMSTDFHAYTPDPGSLIKSPSAHVGLSNSQIVLSLGFRL